MAALPKALRSGQMQRPDLTAAAHRRMQRRRERQRRRGPQVKEQTATQKLLERKPARTDPPLVWPGVAQFSKDKEEFSQEAVIQIAKQCGLLDELRAATDYNFGGGRPRVRGEWILAFLAYLQSGTVDIQPWWRETSPLMWWEAGFSKRPTYETTRNRFKELEELAEGEIFKASAKLIRVAIEKTGGRVCFDVHGDCTEAETNARLHHDCKEGEGCPGWERERTDRHGKPIRAKNGEAKTPDRVPTQEVTAERHRRSDEPIEDEDGNPIVDSAERLTYDEGTGTLRVRVGRHWWRAVDPTAGPRAYTGPKGAMKFWLGFYNLKLVCHTFGEPVVNIIEAADESEFSLLPDAVDRLLEICGEDHVRSFSADKGFMSKSNCLYLAEHGITAVMPFRAHRGEEEKPQDHEAFDRDGVPRCKFCGGETEFVRFMPSPKPRLWFRCKRPRPECLKPAKGDERAEAKVQTILCSTDARYLLPLWRNTAAYQVLKEHGMPLERAHAIARARTANGGKSAETRPKRIGRDWQQLRATGSVLLNWLKILWRQGWIEGAIERNDEQPYFEDGSELLWVMKAHRRAEGLERPYGRKAVEHGTGPERPSYKYILDADTGLQYDIESGDLVDTETGEVIAEAAGLPQLPKLIAGYVAEQEAEAEDQARADPDEAGDDDDKPPGPSPPESDDGLPF